VDNTTSPAYFPVAHLHFILYSLFLILFGRIAYGDRAFRGSASLHSLRERLRATPIPCAAEALLTISLGNK
jgi:hypothetical protein